MGQKVKSNLFNKNNIISTLAVLSFIGVILLSAYIILFTQNVNEQNKITAEQFFKTGVQDVQQQYCIDNGVKPCNQDTINAHADSFSKEQ
jgi:hypothetical protein